MGTRGYVVYRLRGRHYITYSHWDSYPTGLGRKILLGIPTDPAEFQSNNNPLFPSPVFHPLTRRRMETSSNHPLPWGGSSNPPPSSG